VCTADILAGKTNAAPTEILAAMSTWGAVHGPQSAYNTIALKLLSLFATSPGANRKRQREENDGDGLQRSRAFSFGEGIPGPPQNSLRRSIQGGQISYPQLTGNNGGRSAFANTF